MYITETTEKVRELIAELEEKSDLGKLKFLIYIFGLLNNKQINDKNETNPDLIEDDEINIFTLDLVGLSSTACETFLNYLTLAYNLTTDTTDAYIDNGNVLGIENDREDNHTNSLFEKLNFNEKLDVFSEVIIKYDNQTLFDEDYSLITFSSKLNGFDIANLIQKIKI